MKKLAYFVSIVLLSTGMTVAQTSNTQDQSMSQSASDAAKQAGQKASDTAGQAADKVMGNDQTPQNAPTADQSTAAAPADQSATAKHKLPQTASPLPLLALLGAGLIGVGYVFRGRFAPNER